MRQQVPSHNVVVLPDGIVGMDEKTFVVVQHISQHQAYEAEQQVFRPEPGSTLQRRSGGRHDFLPQIVAELYNKMLAPPSSKNAARQPERGWNSHGIVSVAEQAAGGNTLIWCLRASPHRRAPRAAG